MLGPAGTVPAVERSHTWWPGTFAMRTIARFVASLVVTALAASPGRAADAPATRPVLPPLDAGADPAVPFAVDGVCGLTATHGFGFRFATDGTRQACAVFDPRDGTPFYLSDGRQTLVYDLTNERIVRVPNSRAYVQVDWDPKDERPLRFSLGMNFDDKPEALGKTRSFFRADRFVEASARSLRRLPTADDTDLFAAERANNSVEAVQVPRGKPDWVRFTSAAAGEDFYRIHFLARVGGDAPPAPPAFPDLGALRREIEVVEFDQQLMPDFLQFLKSGRASLAKMGLAGGPEWQKGADKVLLSPDWGELGERDRKLGGRYRAALAKQGLVFRAPADAPATRPTR